MSAASKSGRGLGNGFCFMTMTTSFGFGVADPLYQGLQGNREAEGRGVGRGKGERGIQTMSPPESVVIGATIGGATRRELVQNSFLRPKILPLDGHLVVLFKHGVQFPVQRVGTL